MISIIYFIFTTSGFANFDIKYFTIIQYLANCSPAGEGGKNVSYFEMYHGCKNDLHIHSQDLDADCATGKNKIRLG